jgi:U3 small nucleolar RNA-associated protein MPP10
MTVSSNNCVCHVQDDDEDELDYEIVEKEMYNDEEDDNESAENAKFSDFFGNKKPVKSKAAPPSRYADEVDEDFRYDNDDADEGDDVNGEGGDVDVEDNYVEADEEDEGGDDSEEIEEDEGKLTSFQKRQKKLMEEIAELEKGIISAKSWEMKGEVKAADRPENSLLGVYVDVERASKPTPIVTQEFTDTLEDMIIKRITDQIFDDVVPKLMDEGQDEAADLPELSQEKSKEGLGEVIVFSS